MMHFVFIFVVLEMTSTAFVHSRKVLFHRTISSTILIGQEVDWPGAYLQKGLGRHTRLTYWVHGLRDTAG